MKRIRYILTVGVFLSLLCSDAFAFIGVNPKLFAEAYDETINFHRDGDNTITSGHLIEGLKATSDGFVKSTELYLKQRYGSDANKDYWNNRGEMILGGRIRFFSKIYLAFFYEYIFGWYMGDTNQTNPNPYGDSFRDTRYGLIFWQGADKEYAKERNQHFPLSFWDEIYADAIHYQKDDNNVASFTNIRAGYRLLRIHKTVFDVYSAWYFAWDINKDYWNNKFELGPGLRIKPWDDLELSLFVEFLNGYYIDRNGRYPLPGGKEFNDRRYGVLFWHGLGF